MGLLEKALNYKKEINDTGKDTLIDRIKGPAETDILEADLLNKELSGDETVNLSNAHESEIGNIPAPDSEDSSILLEPDDFIYEELQDKEEKTMKDEYTADDEIFSLETEDLVEIKDEKETDKTDETFEAVEDKSLQVTPDKHLTETQNDLTEYPEDLITVSNNDENPKDEDNPAEDLNSEIAPEIVKDDELIPEKELPVENSSEISQTELADSEFGNDYQVLYNIQKDINRAESLNELFDEILFSIMGQLGVSSSSVLVKIDTDSWFIAESRGIVIEEQYKTFPSSDSILKELFKRNGIIDIDEFADKNSYRDSYYKFIGIDAKLLLPLKVDKIITGIIILGEKLDSEEYSEFEKVFLESISEIASSAMFKINSTQALELKNEEFLKKLEETGNEKLFLEKILNCSGLDDAGKVIQNEFKNAGLLAYGVFMLSANGDYYYPVICEPEDYLSLIQSGFSINIGSDFVKNILKKESPVEIDDFKVSGFTQNLFETGALKKMEILRIYPLMIGNCLSGFVSLFRKSEEITLDLIDIKVQNTVKYLIPSLYEIKKNDIVENRYSDTIEITYRRIEKELNRAEKLGNPLTLVLFSIKNFKRYYNLFGRDVVELLLDRFENVISMRLSDSDFSVRYDRQKILLVLPGKDKKFAVPLANVIRNEVVHSFSKREMQLLLTYLTASYPEDGEDLHTLIDFID